MQSALLTLLLNVLCMHGMHGMYGMYEMMHRRWNLFIFFREDDQEVLLIYEDTFYILRM